MTTTAYVLDGNARYHRTATCQALDTASLFARGEITEVTTGTTDHTPCLVCATAPASEWLVTPDNLGELLEIVDPSKVHYAPAPPGHYVSVVADGLTVMAHKGQPRVWARFGDTIRRERGGRYTVQHATPTTALEN
jgi:hypothetical protein